MKKISLYAPIYSLTLLLSAALLFSVQPMFAKMVLPLLGGTPQVWNTAMLFFQVILLAGYGYAHATSRFLGARTQAALHILILCGFLAALPIGIPPGWAPPTKSDPTVWQLSLMLMTVGGPFFALAASAPMLQRWFAATDHPDAANPYFLYGASNLGSMTALIAYPVIIEPFLTLTAQAHLWMLSYIGLIVLMLASALLVWNGARLIPVANRNADNETITWRRRFLWLALAFVPSSLMLGVTTFITTDIAAVPLLWIAPLALYVGTFILVFARKPILSKRFILTAQAVFLSLLLGKMISQYGINPVHLILLHLSLFFFCAMACHTELAAGRPGASRLTEFYLIMSLGGALGGVFNAIIAPLWFVIPLEYAIALAAAVSLRHVGDQGYGWKDFNSQLKNTIRARGIDSVFTPGFFLSLVPIFAALFAFVAIEDHLRLAAAVIATLCMILLADRRWIFAGLTCVILVLFPPGYDWGSHIFTNVIFRDRNFFGVLKVVEMTTGERILLHGTTNHGTQALDPALKMKQLSYYGEGTPFHDVFDFLDKRPGHQQVGIIGLGVGVLACYHHPGRHFDFFEIDPAVVKIAKNPEWFTFLSECGSPYDIIFGDGRLTMKDRPDHSYDAIILDAFTSDNIPAHLLTKEAIDMYLKKLKPNGLLVFHISNNYLDIEPVLAKAAESLSIPGYARVSGGAEIKGSKLTRYPSHVFSISNNEQFNKYIQTQGWTPGRERAGVYLWTDQYSNIVSVLENRTGASRLRAENARLKTLKQVPAHGK